MSGSENMRNIKRQIDSFDEIIEIIKNAKTVRIGINGGEYPYVVPMSYGYDVENGKAVIYIHGAAEGKRFTMLSANPDVCAEFDEFHGFFKVPGSATAHYESVIGFGRAIRLSGAEAKKGLDLIMEHCGFGGEEYSCPVSESVAVYRITLEKISGKRNM